MGKLWTLFSQIDDGTGALDVNVVAGNISINPGDIQIGAVEIKNATTDDRCVVGASGDLHVSLYDPTGVLLQGQKAMAASVPVALASDQSSIPVTVGGLPLPTGAATEATLSALNAKVPALGQAAMAASFPVVIASNQSAVPVSGSVSVSSSALPTGAATEATLVTVSGKIPALGQAVMASSLPVVLASNQSSIPVTVATLPLPAGAATEATLSTLSGKIPALGQAAMAASMPVVIASNQSAIPVSGTVAVSSSALPTGAATEATLASLSAKVPALGQNNMAGSLPVVIASNQTAFPVTVSSIPLPSGAATEATLSALNGKFYGATGTGLPGPAQPVLLYGNQGAAYQVASMRDPGILQVDVNNTNGPVGVRVTAQGGDDVWRNWRCDDDGSGRAIPYVNLARLGGVAVSVNSGNVDSGTQRVVLASNQPVVAVGGDVANDAADSGNPQKMGGVARTANPTAVANGDRVNASFDKLGRQVVAVGQVRDLVTQGNVTLSNTTETTVLAAGGTGVFHDVTQLVLSNTSTVGVRVDLRDDTGGTVRLSVFLAANGGGAVIPFSRPMKATASNDNWTAQLSATPTGGDVRVFLQAEKNL